MSDLKYYLTGGPAFARSFRLFAELDFDTSIVFAKHKAGDVSELTMSHIDYDGVNGFTHVLAWNDALLPMSFPAVPQRRKGFAPFVLLKRFLQYFRVLWQFSRKSREWKTVAPKAPGFVTAWRFFSAEQTAKLRERARGRGVSLNSHLFFSLNDTVKGHLAPSKNPATWIIPVSLYKNFDQAKVPGMRTSIMEVSVSETDTPVKIHERVRKEIERETYWGTIVAVLINNVLTDGIIRKVLKSTVASKKRVGTFSNIGKWKGKESSADEGWSVVPPVHPGQPLGCGALEFNGKLGLGMKLDPCLGMDDSAAGRLIDAWSETAFKEVTQ